MPEHDLIDISRVIAESTAVWPGDTPFSRRYVMKIGDGCSCNTSTYTLSAHTGTHADSPHHYVEGAPATDAVPLSAYIGRCRVLTARNVRSIGLADIEGLDLAREERLLFRTLTPMSDDRWREDFAYLEPDLAAAVAKGGLKLIGLDTPSVDPMTSKTLSAHKALLTGQVAILESLDLSRAKDGVYELIALPLRIQGGDASPVRAVLRPYRGAP